MNIVLNGEEREVPEGLTVGMLLRLLKLPADRLAVERNREIVPRGEWDTTPVSSNDSLEIVQFVGGG
ncbi:MAG: sulfur carrier protein ThiS [Terriglobia bacterium]